MLAKFFSLFLSFLLLFLLLFFTGCFSGNQGDDIGGFLGGTRGLIMGLEEGAPPSEVLDAGTNPFSVVINLVNVGETSVGPGTDSPLVFIRLSGIDYNSFGLTEESAVKTLDVKLESAKRNFDGSEISGETNYLTFDNLAYEPDVAANVPLRLRIELCYDYESYASTSFCMKRDLLRNWDDNSICDISGPKPVGNSGSPLHITNVEQRPIDNDTIQLNFVIEHLGTGGIFYRSSYSSLSSVCSFNDANRDLNKFEIFFEPVQQGMYTITCPRLDNQSSSSTGVRGVVKLFENSPITISCYLSRSAATSVQAYTDLINIRMRYRYGGIVELPFTILANLYTDS
jgi:hypothetical protein